MDGSHPVPVSLWQVTLSAAASQFLWLLSLLSPHSHRICQHTIRPRREEVTCTGTLMSRCNSAPVTISYREEHSRTGTVKPPYSVVTWLYLWFCENIKLSQCGHKINNKVGWRVLVIKEMTEKIESQRSLLGCFHRFHVYFEFYEVLISCT